MKQTDKLRATWSRKERDVMLHFPPGRQTQCDGHYLSSVFNNEFVAELVRRGYDIETMKFSVEPSRGNDRFASQRPATAESPSL